MPRTLLALVLLIGLLLLVPLASAHWDQRIERQEHTLVPGEALRLPFEAHYHRLVGSVQIIEPHDGSAQIDVMRQGDPETMRAVEMRGGGRITTFIACCDDATWTDHELLVTNPLDVPLIVSVEARLIHDDLIVIAHDAEPGAGWQTAFIFGLITTLFAVRAHRRLARPMDEGVARRHLQRSRMLWGTMLGIALFGMVFGTVRYGGGPLSGGVASAVVVPYVPYTGAALIAMVLLIGLWIGALYQWVQSHGRWDGAHRALATWGVVLFIGVLMVFTTMILEHGAVWNPVLITTAISLPLLVIIGMHLRVMLRAAGAPDGVATEDGGAV